MKIKLVVSPMRYANQEAEVEVPDGLTDEQIDSCVADDLGMMRDELVDSWWEKIEDEGETP